jgi:hypothetical protein
VGDSEGGGDRAGSEAAQTELGGVLRQQAASILECDFLTVDTLFLKRFYVLFFVELATRRVHSAGITINPDRRWVTQQARNLLMQLDDDGIRPRFLVRDRDGKFTRDFDEVFRSEEIQMIKAPVRAPTARAHAERWVGSVRRECLDRILIVGRRHLQHLLVAYVRQFNEHRPHRALGQRAPLCNERPLAEVINPDRLRRRDLLGGLIHEYQLAASSPSGPDSFKAKVPSHRLVGRAAFLGSRLATECPMEHAPDATFTGSVTPFRTG